jgi:hypothetical protein
MSGILSLSFSANHTCNNGNDAAKRRKEKKMDWETWSTLAAFGIVMLFLALDKLGKWIQERKEDE